MIDLIIDHVIYIRRVVNEYSGRGALPHDRRRASKKHERHLLGKHPTRIKEPKKRL